MAIVTAFPLPALVTALCAAFALSGCGVSVDFGGSAVERSGSETIVADGVRPVQIRTDDGRVVVPSSMAVDVETDNGSVAVADAP